MLWRQITSAAQNFKLGHNVQRPYPWRGTTPLVCIFFVGLTILLVFVNIPLSAYDIVQEFTYTPNVTSSSLPFSNIIPASLRHTAGNFMPQTFTVGDTIQTHSSVFSYEIATVFPRGTIPYKGLQVSSFPYCNNPLSSCDVLNISLSLRKEEPVLFSATISCWIPTYYKMTLNLNHSSMQDRMPELELPLSSVYDLDGILRDLEYGWDSENVTLTANNKGESAPTTAQDVTGIQLSVSACCVCTNGEPPESYFTERTIQSDPFLFDHPPCDDDVAKFQATGMTAYYGQDSSFSDMNITPGGNILPSDQELEVPSNVQLVLQNALQAIYSAIRLDLGVSRPNQIFPSPIMFNKSISSVSLFQPPTSGRTPNCDIGDTSFGSYSYMKATFVVNDSLKLMYPVVHIANIAKVQQEIPSLCCYYVAVAAMKRVPQEKRKKMEHKLQWSDFPVTVGFTIIVYRLCPVCQVDVKALHLILNEIHFRDLPPIPSIFPLLDTCSLIL
ncbi:hypothetical protein IW261DRAFT_1610594, partial [Armillaria novae-zelandiae]